MLGQATTTCYTPDAPGTSDIHVQDLWEYNLVDEAREEESCKLAKFGGKVPMYRKRNDSIHKEVKLAYDHGRPVRAKEENA